MNKSSVISLLAIYIVCSSDKGLTREVFTNVRDAFYADQCLVFSADRVDGQIVACTPKVECVIKEGTVPPAGSDMRNEKDK